MLLTIGFLIGLVIASPRLLGAAAEPTSKQSEWHFLPTDYVDIWTGALHDSDSGAFIAFERGFKSMMSASAPSMATKHGAILLQERKGPWAYSYVILPESSGGRPDRWSDLCAGDHGQYQRVEASFTSDAASYIRWNFTAFTCTEQERAAVMDFLLRDPNRWSSMMDDAQQARVHELRKGDIARLVRGQKLGRLQQTLGLANVVERRGAGFDLSFPLLDSRPPAHARLHFNRAGDLVDWKLEPPPVAR